MKEELKTKFGMIEDERHPSYVEHKLCDILIIIMYAVLCGLDELAEIVEYAQNKSEFLRDGFGIEKIPSKPTFSRIMNMMDGEKVAAIMIEIMRENARELGEIIAVDGKTIRSTAKKGKAHSALQILTAYLTESGITIAQEAIHEKTNEIPVFQEMLDSLDVKGKTITADAMHCQKETCKKIIEKGGNYLLGLKENQKSFYDEIDTYFADNHSAFETFSTTEKGHRRIEKRICYKLDDISWLSMREEWEGLKSVLAVKRTIEQKSGVSQEISYYISSLDASCEKLLTTVREHWKIESLHWLLDVTFSEDECRMISENGHKTLNALRKLALFLHKQFLDKQAKKKSLKGNMLNCLMNDNLLLRVILGGL